MFIPPMLLQPIVENAIWHGLLPKGSDTSWTFNCILTEWFLICFVEDNRIGCWNLTELKQEQVLEKSSIPVSVQPTASPVAEQGSEKGKLLEIDPTGADGHSVGTRVILHIPYSNKPVAWLKFQPSTRRKILYWSNGGTGYREYVFDAGWWRFAKRKKGIRAIYEHKPDPRFSILKCPGMSGFDMFEKLLPFHFDVIFTTAYDNYAIRAFKYTQCDGLSSQQGI